jgi:hypothetical protein
VHPCKSAEYITAKIQPLTDMVPSSTPRGVICAILHAILEHILLIFFLSTSSSCNSHSGLGIGELPVYLALSEMLTIRLAEEYVLKNMSSVLC